MEGKVVWSIKIEPSRHVGENFSSVVPVGLLVVGNESIVQNYFCLDCLGDLEQPLFEDLAFPPDLLLEVELFPLPLFFVVSLADAP
eukprot:4398101-Ditylum_brightwellii.AAC.1